MTGARYPHYDVLDKRDTVSWDDVTRKVIDERLHVPERSNVLSDLQWNNLRALCECIVPQPIDSNTIPVASMIEQRLAHNELDGYRDARLPPFQQAWLMGLDALESESQSVFHDSFFELMADKKHALLTAIQKGDVQTGAWKDLPADLFFAKRLVKDICATYYSHPNAWSEIGFGGPANPRGYVRMYFDKRDPWEAVEVKDDASTSTRRG